MPDIRSIPDGVKWKLATECAARLPAMYELAFSPVVGEKYDELEQVVWAGLSHDAFTIARLLQLPVNTSQHLADSMRLVLQILFGPGYKGEVMDVGEDGAVIIVKQCPFVSEATAIGASPDRAFKRCLAFNLSAQKNLNPNYKTRYVRALCMGDRQCEIKVDREPEPGKKPDSKKQA
jgi:predicted ArsR family transcriptional regulator